MTERSISASCWVAAVVTDTGSVPRPVDPKDRGRLVVADRVVERISVIAAGEVPGVVSTGSALDSALGHRYPRAEADVAGQRANVHLRLAVAWPTPLATTAQGVRDRVRAQVNHLAAIEVDAVDVTIAQVVHEEPQTERRVQ